MNLNPARTLLLAGVLTTICLSTFSQLHIDSNKVTYALRTTNSCGVTASFTPTKDSVVSGPFSVNLTNTSKNATSVKWIVDGWWLSSDNTYSFTNSTPGIYVLKMIAYNGNCSDTATCVYIYPGAQPADRNNLKGYYGLVGKNDYSSSFISLKEGGYVIGGYTNTNYGGEYNNGMIIKVAESGCIEWSKKIAHSGFGQASKIAQSADGNIAVTGYTDKGHYLLKLSPQGNMLWSKSYTLNGEPFRISQMTATSDGGFVLAGDYEVTFDNSLGVIRTNAVGDVIWSRRFYKNSYFDTYHQATDLLQLGNNVYVAVNVFQDGYPIKPDTNTGLLIKINDLTGKTSWTKKILINGKNANVRSLDAYGNSLLLNIDGTENAVSVPNNSFMIMDENDNITRSATLMMGKTNYPLATTVAMPLTNGDIYFLNYGKETLQLQPGYAYHSYFIKLDKNDQVKWARQYGSYGRGRYFYGAVGQNNTFAAIGDELGTAYAGFGYLSDKIMFSKMDSSGGDGQNSCGFYNADITVKQNTMQTGAFTWNMDSIPSSQALYSVPNITTTYTSVFYTCPKEFVDSCSFVQVTGPSDICNLNSAYVYKTHRNLTCNQPVLWDIPANATVIEKSDTALTLKFTAPGNYFVGAALPYTCSPVKDSVYVKVGLRTPPLSLGTDTSICAGNTMTLHAGSRYAKYTWQDGSTDSLFTVTTPGSYWITVSDSCENILSDTINISISARVPLFIGADRIKCNNDTLQLTAPSGFLNYRWSNNYNINSLTSRSVIVNPDIDTSYYLKAEKSPGCFGFDTVAIKVNHSAKINIGADTSICRGDSITINAGDGFENYLWSNGSSTSKITTGSKGLYSVTVTTNNGCKSSDTLQVLSVFNNPVVKFNKDSTLCAGSTRTLDAGGNYSSYLWSNGSNGKTLTINAVGTYFVKVEDSNGCQGGDSVKINRLLNSPANFLPADTSICSYGSLNISALNNYGSYRWNTNEITKSIIIKRPGTYTLEVVDNNHCIGVDTIYVSQKQCLDGIYVPSAFTPNGDSKNDVFKPRIFGNVVSYTFVIYNRYGGKIFETTDLQKGWNGISGSAPLQPGGYVWICRFRLAGQQERLEKGAVIIVR